MNKYLFLLFIYFSIPFIPKAQQKLVVHAESVDSLFKWFDSGFQVEQIPSLLTLPANQFMEQLLFENEKESVTFSEALHSFSAQHPLSDNPYLLNEAYENRTQITELLSRLTDSIHDNRILDYVTGYFPADFIPSAQYNVYFTATGWKWGDAMAFNYSKNGDNYVVTEVGIPAIIFNLTIITSTYGKTIEKQISTFGKVLSHELFHALLEDYIAGKNYYNPGQIESKALFLLLNEGIAHFIADVDYIKANYDLLKEKEQNCFSLFDEKLKIIMDNSVDMELRNAALEEGLYGSYWEKYICITGLFMAYHIHQSGGEELLRECIEKGSGFFIQKYREICQENNNLPLLPEWFYK